MHYSGHTEIIEIKPLNDDVAQLGESSISMRGYRVCFPELFLDCVIIIDDWARFKRILYNDVSLDIISLFQSKLMVFVRNLGSVSVQNPKAGKYLYLFLFYHYYAQ